MTDDTTAPADPAPAADGAPEGPEAVATEAAEKSSAATGAEAAESGPAAANDTLEKVRAELDKVRRFAADLDNQKKRLLRDRERELTDKQASVLRGVLPVVDNFERAMASLAGTNDPAAVKAGTEQIYRLFVDWLGKQGVNSIPAVGQPYDPHLHEAVMHAPSAQHPEGAVSMEMEKGYFLGERVLRHAKVGVSSGPPATEAPETAGGNGGEAPAHSGEESG